MANYLEVIEDTTVTSGNETESFTAGELVNPYDDWADVLLNSNLVIDSGQPAPYLAGESPDPFAFNYGQVVNIYEVTEAAYTFQHRDAINAEVHGNSATTQTFKIPNHRDSRWLKGTHITVRQVGAGAINIIGDTEVTLDAPYGLSTGDQFSSLYLLKVDDNDWIVMLENGGAGAGGSSPTNIDGGNSTSSYA